MTTITPLAPLQQHMAALATANDIRFGQCALKRRVHAGELTVTDVLADPPPFARSLTIGELLRAQNRWGTVRAADFLGRLRITETRRVGDLTDRQRGLIITHLAAIAPAPRTPTTSLGVLERSLPQRLDALHRANLVRARRAKLKKDLKAGRVSIHALLAEPPDEILTMKVFDLVIAMPKYGRVKIAKVLADCRVAPSTTVGGLSDRQRRDLIGLIRSRDIPLRAVASVAVGQPAVPAERVIQDQAAA